MDKRQCVMAAQTIQEIDDCCGMLKNTTKIIEFTGSDDEHWDEDALTAIGSALCYAANRFLNIEDDLDKYMMPLFNSKEEDYLFHASMATCGLGELFKCAATGDWKKMDGVPFTMAERFVERTAEEVSMKTDTLKKLLTESAAEFGDITYEMIKDALYPSIGTGPAATE